MANLPRLAAVTWAGSRGSSSSSAGGPGPRCGHSLTPVISDAGPRLILFGGATALEGSGSGSGSSGIRTLGLLTPLLTRTERDRSGAVSKPGLQQQAPHRTTFPAAGTASGRTPDSNPRQPQPGRVDARTYEGEGSLPHVGRGHTPWRRALLPYTGSPKRAQQSGVMRVYRALYCAHPTLFRHVSTGCDLTPVASESDGEPM
jgi:hypothetical protein